MVLSGHVKNSVIVLDEPVKLPEGIKVKILISDKTLKESGLCGIWQDSRSADEIVDEIISSRSKGRDIKL